MDQATEIETARIDELLGAYRNLQTQFNRVLERVRRAEAEKDSVPRRIYDRVRAEYDRELDGIRARMSPLRDEIDRLHEAVESQCQEVQSVVQAVEEELAEIEFRHRVGEFAADAFDDRRRELDARAAEVRTRHDSLQSTLTTIASMRNPDSRPRPTLTPAQTSVSGAAAPVENVTPPAAVAQTPAVEAPAAEISEVETPASEPLAPETPVDEAPLTLQGEEALTLDEVLGPDPGAADPESKDPEPEAASGFENPHDWISDMKQDGAARPERRARLSTPAPAAPAAPAAAPARRKDELDSALAPLSVADSWPSLVFVSGTRAGQAIALLPTTLTIGREHDNNVEIKDAEVARYHARIVRNRDTYVVEDLNSSTGTWVNGQRTERAVLTHGDVIRVGQTELAIDFEWTTDSR